MDDRWVNASTMAVAGIFAERAAHHASITNSESGYGHRRRPRGPQYQGSRWVRTSAEPAEVRARRVPRISHPRLASPDTVW